jgi:hypothetical protein
MRWRASCVFVDWLLLRGNPAMHHWVRRCPRCGQTLLKTEAWSIMRCPCGWEWR